MESSQCWGMISAGLGTCSSVTGQTTVLHPLCAEGHIFKSPRDRVGVGWMFQHDRVLCSIVS